MIHLTRKGINSLQNIYIVKLEHKERGMINLNKADPMTITGKRIRQLIKRKGLTEAAFAESIGVKPTALSAWITGSRRPAAQSLMLLAENLTTTVDYLTGRSDDPCGYAQLRKERGFYARHPAVVTQLQKNEVILQLIELLQYDIDPVLDAIQPDSNEVAPGIRSIIPDIEEFVDCKCNKYLKRIDRKDEHRE